MSIRSFVSSRQPSREDDVNTLLLEAINSYLFSNGWVVDRSTGSFKVWVKDDGSSQTYAYVPITSKISDFELRLSHLFEAIGLATETRASSVRLFLLKEVLKNVH